MKIALRTRPAPDLPGVQGPARVDRRIGPLVARARAGEIVVCDHVDLDREAAQALAETGIVGLVNVGALISGRYPSLGPQVLVNAGISVVDEAGPEILSRIKDGARLRVDGGVVYSGEDLVATGRELDADAVRQQMSEARAGLGAQLESFTHNTTEFLRREQDLLLHGQGLPRTATSMMGRPVVVVVRSHDWESELCGLKPFIREQDPVLIGVDAGATALASHGHWPDIVLVTAGNEPPSAKVLRKARDVVVLAERGTDSSVTEQLERMSLRPERFETGVTAEDGALLLAAAAKPKLIVGVGMHATIEEFLDRKRAGLASTFLTRLKLGPLLVDAATVPTLYDGAVRPRHVLGVTIACLVALGAAIGITPVGQEWYADLQPALQSVIDNIRGTLS